uniref:Uncharacterized protein n=2 Tax=Attheya septentrionalis TaxID=420275 RepID=A0A7S2UQD4_9STRA|mmetsp:Transcript_5643/g.9926  ORF Transcript_5643/g.9926 Transcript_5643/m.9926 type:complete len:509 (+) Transcript_5643:159-1685(+)|eukprot:CAMPEP_0198293490 /NCGR_PEP_ID=MMETSP1449-20131203/17348_1 /TAXON_ID=420275 /ORGANISM="Attheya septentrionalis, Strain CCMP2084" /LENGTH=508 /DNA_ID=CAMNT_0043993081 /DNA_START=102 /DNA_END=1628 /DNA_ORIENTATION=-
MKQSGVIKSGLVVVISGYILRLIHLELSLLGYYERSKGYTKISSHPDKFITFKVLRDLPFHGVVGHDPYVCDIKNRAFHNSFTRPGVLDFHTRVKTNLNILYIGSSIGHQFARAFQEAAMSIDREVIRYAWWVRRQHENTHVALTPDNGTISGLRVTGLFTNMSKDVPKTMAPAGGGGWLTYDIREMKRMVHQWRPVKAIDTAWGKSTSPCEIETPANNFSHVNGTRNMTSSAAKVNAYSCKQKDFDVVVHQLPVEWIENMYFDQSITNDVLDEVVGVSFNYLGASTIILQTIPINNNARSLDELVIVNRRIWDYARAFELNATKRNENSTGTTTIPATHRRRILVMDLYSYSVDLFVQNSIEIGIITKNKGEELQSKLSNSVNPHEFLNLTMGLSEAFNHTMPIRGQRQIERKIGHTCGDVNCNTKSMISYDGMHWCMRETGGRLNAGLACLIQCSLMNNDETRDDVVRLCERKCNARFMSLVPLSWEENGTQFNVNGTNLTGIAYY